MVGGLKRFGSVRTNVGGQDHSFCDMTVKSYRIQCRHVWDSNPGETKTLEINQRLASFKAEVRLRGEGGKGRDAKLEERQPRSKRS